MTDQPATPEPTPQSGASLIDKTQRGFGRLLLSRRFAFILAAAAVVAGTATFGLLTGTSTGTGTPDAHKVVALLAVDLVILLMLVAIIAQRVVAMWTQHRRGQAGSALHVRLVVMFSLLSVAPTILVTLFAVLFLNFGIDSWFSSRVRTAVDASQAVANAYLQEHIQSIRADALALANDLNRDAARLSRSRARLSQFLSAQTGLRGLTETIVIDANAQVLAKSNFATLDFSAFPTDAMAKADLGEIVIVAGANTDRVRALVKLEGFIGAYLVAGRFVDVRVLSNMERVREASRSYLRLEERSGTIQITFVAIFAVVSLLLLLASVWIGMTLANQLARPISRLIDAAQKVSGGDLTQRVEAEGAIDELGTLSKAFNDMTGQIAAQQEGLIHMNRKLDERRRFTETVLGGVSAGVVGLDSEGRVNLPNRSASLLLGVDLQGASGRYLAEVAPEMAEIIAEVQDRPDRVVQAEITLVRENAPRTLTVNAAAEQLEGDVFGYVVTFDDITELQSAQRKAAWSGVARRIAHEIKNPLTPIQLSAERLKRKYLKQITDDPETFVTCTDTIVRQVEDLGRMVDEFSSFARMPQPALSHQDVADICRQALFLERSREGGVEIESDLPDGKVILNCDATQISRVLTNILKNATEAVTARLEQDGDGGGEVGRIRLELKQFEGRDGARTVIQVEDNGTGLPEADMARLTEPYVTTRDRGTGLGLAIVKKIMEDHGGDLLLENKSEGGARVVLTFPPVEAQTQTSLTEADQSLPQASE